MKFKLTGTFKTKLATLLCASSLLSQNFSAFAESAEAPADQELRVGSYDQHQILAEFPLAAQLKAELEEMDMAIETMKREAEVKLQTAQAQGDNNMELASKQAARDIYEEIEKRDRAAKEFDERIRDRVGLAACLVAKRHNLNTILLKEAVIAGSYDLTAEMKKELEHLESATESESPESTDFEAHPYLACLDADRAIANCPLSQKAAQEVLRMEVELKNLARNAQERVTERSRSGAGNRELKSLQKTLQKEINDYGAQMKSALDAAKSLAEERLRYCAKRQLNSLSLKAIFRKNAIISPCLDLTATTMLCLAKPGEEEAKLPESNIQNKSLKPSEDKSFDVAYIDLELVRQTVPALAEISNHDLSLRLAPLAEVLLKSSGFLKVIFNKADLVAGGNDLSEAALNLLKNQGLEKEKK